jgi:HrpA-like RNA helicase
LKRPQFQSPENAMWVLSLHGGLPPEEQRRVFERPPQGIRKIVLATNVAETSITIDDVGFVIDTARMKEQRYDPTKRLASLEDCFVSRANARQRRGRAGRVAPGVAVHLFSRHTHDKIIDSHQAPEVQRVPLEQLVLRIRAMNLPGTAAAVCERLLEPPSHDAVEKAVLELVSLEALAVNKEDNSEELTDLGKHLANLPVDARLGKLILLGSAFGPEATDMALTAAAALACRTPFLSPPDAREEAEKSKWAFADRGFAEKGGRVSVFLSVAEHGGDLEHLVAPAVRNLDGHV